MRRLSFFFVSQPARFASACLVAGVSWIVAEVAGGLAFLSFGVRLWRYEIAPLFFDITSPLVWICATVLIVPLSLAFDVLVKSDRLAPGRRALARLAFLMTTGSVLEVVLNRHVFATVFGRPLYSYLVLPTFEGSGSLLSPLYYATLYVHVPIADRLLKRAQRSAARTSSRSSTRIDRAASMS